MSQKPEKKKSLSFKDKHLEREYQIYTAEETIWYVRFALLLCALVFMSFGVVDLFSLSRYKEDDWLHYSDTIWLMRIAFVIACAIIFFLTYTRWYKQNMQLIIFALGLFAAIALLYRIDVLADDNSSHNLAGFMLLFYFIGIRYVYLVTIVVFSLCLYVYIMNFRIYYNHDFIYTNMIYMSVGGVYAVFMSFLMENMLRNLFLKSKEKEKEKQHYERVTQQLSKYIAPQVYNSIFTGFKDVQIGTHRKNLTILFSDIVNFTSISETKQPDELAIWLNDYLNEMSQISLNYRGTLDKFIGDGIMVFFGDPVSSGEQSDAIYCIIMAIAMRHKARRMNVNIRIGINSGECTVGNFGSLNRMEYTVVGKPVNIAAYLEKQADTNDILISEDTYELVKHIIRCEYVEVVNIKGSDKAVATYRVLEENGQFN